MMYDFVTSYVIYVKESKKLVTADTATFHNFGANTVAEAVMGVKKYLSAFYPESTHHIIVLNVWPE